VFDQTLIDLSQLVGGDSFTIPCTLSLNGTGTVVQALNDSGANGFLFVNTRLARDISSFLGAEIIPLAREIPLKGFDGKASSPVTQALFLNMSIDGRRQLLAPFLIVDIGGHDMIIGRKWFSYFNIHLDIRKRRLLWPPEHPPTPYFAREILIPRESLTKSNSTLPYQDDIDYRQQLFDIEDARSAKKGSIAHYTVAELQTAIKPLMTTRHPPAPIVEDCPEPITQDEALEELLSAIPKRPITQHPLDTDAGYKSKENIQGEEIPVSIENCWI